MAVTNVTQIPNDKFEEFVQEQKFRISSSRMNQKYSVDSPPGKIEDRVFIGGNYVLMPILREIESAVESCHFQPVIAYDFDIPKEKTREYTIRLLYQCKHAIFEETISDGQLVEVVRSSGFREMRMLQVYMATDHRREPPKTMSTMVWQVNPPPRSYLTIDELKLIVIDFLLQSRFTQQVKFGRGT